jgi:transposase
MGDLMRVKKRTYTDEFRADAVGLYRRTERSVKQVAADLGVNHWTLKDWIERDEMKRKTKEPAERRARAASNETPHDKLARLERENARLQRENEQLREDREILKKAAAFFAKESE